MKKIIFISIGGLGFFAIVAGFALHVNLIHLPIVRHVDASLVTDFSDDRKLMGASHNVFVGKVVKQVSTTQDNGLPETQFSVQVISNVKGNLPELVTVNQEGGYKNGILYTLQDGDVMAPKKDADDGLLKTGTVYLLATRFDEGKNQYTLIANPFGSKAISQDSKLNNEELRSLLEKDKRTIQLQEAYKNEILLDADVKNGNTRNSYQSLQEK